MRKVEFYFHNSDITVTGKVLEEKLPQIADEMWDFIETPRKCYAHHTLSTGGDIVLKPVPTYEPVKIGNQSNPLGGDIPYFTDMKPGQINWRGSTWGVIYDKCTEPLNSGGPVMIEIEEENLESFCKACYDLWRQTSLYHNVGIVTVSRKEG